MMDSESEKSSVRWPRVAWPTLALWAAACVYVLFSEYRPQAPVLLPILMVASLVAVLLMNMIARGLGVGVVDVSRIEVARREGDSVDGSMTEAGVRRIEEAFGARLPSDYRRLMMEYPRELLACGASEMELLNEPSRIIAENLRVRSGTESFSLIDWPPRYFVIGETGSGDYYCLNMKRASSPVMLFDQFGIQFKEHAPSLDEWLPAILAEYGRRAAPR